MTGSLGLLQAAMGSFTAGLGNADVDMKNLTQNLVDAFQSVVENIVPILENVVAALPTAIDGILLVGDLLPLLLSTVTDLFTQILETLLSLLPELIPAAVDAVMTIIGALVDSLPLLIDAALLLITALVEGLGLALPELIPSMVEAVILIATTLIQNIDLILDAAFTLINQASAQGLLNALPALIEALPQIIASIVTFFIENYPKLIGDGHQPDRATGSWINSGHTSTHKQNTIISAIVGGFGEGIPSITDIGKDIIKGLWNGISSMVGWIREKVGGAMSGIVGGVKNLLGIHSPSTVFAGIGSNMGQGIGVGFSNAMKNVAAEMKNSIPTDFDGLQVDVSAVGNIIPDTSLATAGTQFL